MKGWELRSGSYWKTYIKSHRMSVWRESDNPVRWCWQVRWFNSKGQMQLIASGFERSRKHAALVAELFVDLRVAVLPKIELRLAREESGE